MTREKSGDTQWPTPLFARKGGLGKLVRAYVQDTEETSDDEASYARLMRRANRSRRPRARALPVLTAGLAVASGLVVAAVVLGDRGTQLETMGPPVRLVSIPDPRPALPGSATPLPPPVPASDTAPRTRPGAVAAVPPSIRLREQATTLPAGRLDLDGQAVAVLSADAVASGRAVMGNTDIELGRGEIALEVLPRAPGHGFSVRAGSYRFSVVGTAFTVSKTRSRLELSVREGTVAVSRGGVRLALVTAHGEWAVSLQPVPSATSSSVEPAPSTPEPAPPVTPPTTLAPSPPPPPLALAPGAQAGRPVASAAPAASAAPTAPAAPAAPAADCRQLASNRRTSEALLCLQAQAARGGLAGETAQYELGRLLRDALGDRERALAAFEDQRRHFPGGALRIEADLSIIELLPRLGRHHEALRESERFLRDHPVAERSGELRLLRGNIYREVLHDLSRAEREYALGAQTSGRASDDCRFLRAVCLEALGRAAEARQAYQSYLRTGRGAHAQEAQRRLERLQP